MNLHRPAVDVARVAPTGTIAGADADAPGGAASLHTGGTRRQDADELVGVRQDSLIRVEDDDRMIVVDTDQRINISYFRSANLAPSLTPGLGGQIIAKVLPSTGLVKGVEQLVLPAATGSVKIISQSDVDTAAVDLSRRRVTDDMTLLQSGDNLGVTVDTGRLMLGLASHGQAIIAETGGSSAIMCLMSKQGQYIVIEGNDGTGKTTQLELLAKYLSSLARRVEVIEEPGSDDPAKSTPVANYLRQLIKDSQLERSAEINLALFSAARRELWQHKISPALDSGATVLSSRNFISTLAYQGYGEGLDVAHIRQVTELFTSERYMNPDYTIILALDDEAERIRRISQRGESECPDTFESRDGAFQCRVNSGYRKIARRYHFPIIDCLASDGRRKTIDEVQTEIKRIVGA